MQRVQLSDQEYKLMEQIRFEDMLISEMEDYIRMQVEHERAQKEEALKKADEYFHLAQQIIKENLTQEKKNKVLKQTNERLRKENEERTKENEELVLTEERIIQSLSRVFRFWLNEGKDLPAISQMSDLPIERVKNILDQAE
jgi:hypothetical protein